LRVQSVYLEVRRATSFMPILTYIAAGIFALIGLLHLGFALYDFSAKPRYFRPNDDDAMALLKRTHVELAGKGHDYFISTLGIHLCHAIGVVLFAIMILIEQSHEIVGMRPLLALVGLSYALIAWRFWSRRPLSASLVGTAVLFLSWL